MGTEELHLRVDHDLTNHSIENRGDLYDVEALRELARAFAHQVVDVCPPGREQSTALTKIEEATMWAVAAIARS